MHFSRIQNGSCSGRNGLFSRFSLKNHIIERFSINMKGPGLMSRRHSALISSDSEYLPENLWTVLIFSETALKLEIFREKESALNQSCFSADFLWNRADFLWNSAETPNFQSKKISSESALIFSETELITPEAFCNSSYHSWFPPETTLNIPEFCVFQFLSSPEFFAIFLHGNLNITLSGYLIASRQILDLSFFANFCRKAKVLRFLGIAISLFFCKNRSSSLSADFLQETPDPKLSGNLDLSLFSQISAGKLRSYLSWIVTNYSVMAQLDFILFPKIFSRKP